jgi:hypothetical protein
VVSLTDRMMTDHDSTKLASHSSPFPIRKERLHNNGVKVAGCGHPNEHFSYNGGRMNTSVAGHRCRGFKEMMTY